MRLINTKTLGLDHFVDSEAPPYAILSHTWGPNDAELTFSDFDLGGGASSKSGYRKLQGACRVTQDMGIDHLWADTCCIDKSSSAELSEAINSMFTWYRRAVLCLAYLDDLPSEAETDHFNRQVWSKCRWFRRGWTLQELLAPRRVLFYDVDWSFRGEKSTQPLRGLISQITHIFDDVLQDGDRIFEVSVAERMSWAATRETTRIEDRAYSLMGIFDVSMPVLYGEGNKAFRRLQEEIVKANDDLSAFAWVFNSSQSPLFSGLLATSPAQFGHVLSAAADWRQPLVFRGDIFTSSRGLSFEGANFGYFGQDVVFDLGSVGDGSRKIGVLLRAVDDTFVRVSPNQLFIYQSRNAAQFERANRANRDFAMICKQAATSGRRPGPWISVKAVLDRRTRKALERTLKRRCPRSNTSHRGVLGPKMPFRETSRRRASGRQQRQNVNVCQQQHNGCCNRSSLQGASPGNWTFIPEPQDPALSPAAHSVQTVLGYEQIESAKTRILDASTPSDTSDGSWTPVAKSEASEQPLSGHSPRIIPSHPELTYRQRQKLADSKSCGTMGTQRPGTSRDSWDSSSDIFGSDMDTDDDLSILEDLPHVPLLEQSHPFHRVKAELVDVAGEAFMAHFGAQMIVVGDEDEGEDEDEARNIDLTRLNLNPPEVDGGDANRVAAAEAESTASTHSESATSPEPMACRRLACPFWKQNPLSHRSCLLTADLVDIRGTIQHLWAQHRQPEYCPICFETFDLASAWADHVRRRTCTRRPIMVVGGITEDQRLQLASTSDVEAPVEEQWFAVWDIAFPDQPRPDSPFIGGALEQVISLARVFWEMEGREVTANFLGQRDLLQLGTADEESMEALHAEVLVDLLDAIVKEVERETQRHLPTF